MDNMLGLKRTNYCGTLNMSNVGQEVTVCGWVHRQRDLGSLIFIDLRDRTGIVQLAFDESTEKDIFDKAFTVRSEYVIMAKGIVRERSSKNFEIPTGEIEVEVDNYQGITHGKKSDEIKDVVLLIETAKADEVGDETKLKYRYLNLRNEKLTKNIIMRHKIAKIAREYFYENDFLEIETPMMIKSTPEGARDYVVPSRIHNGKFYALPQAPQQFSADIQAALYGCRL